MKRILIDITGTPAETQAWNIGNEIQHKSGIFVNVSIKDYHGSKYDPDTVKWLIIG